MTELAVLSDIHGNLPALTAVIDDLDAFGVDHVVVLGDIINWGPFSEQVLNYVVPAGWAVIRGNNEFYLLDYGTLRQPPEWRNYTLLPWLQDQLGNRWRHVVAAWPDTLQLRYPDAPLVRALHGTSHSISEAVFPATPDAEAALLLSGVSEGTVLCGHSHLPLDRQVGQWHVVNPGSVGVPLDGEVSASYVILESRGSEWRATHRRVPFDVKAVTREFMRQGFLDKCGPIGRLVIKEFETASLQVIPFLGWHAANHPGEKITEALLAEFTEKACWLHTPIPYRIALEDAKDGQVAVFPGKHDL